jgi:hypothetical protein
MGQCAYLPKVRSHNELGLDRPQRDHHGHTPMSTLRLVRPYTNSDH